MQDDIIPTYNLSIGSLERYNEHVRSLVFNSRKLKIGALCI